MRIAFGGSKTEPFHLTHLEVLNLVRTCGLFDLIIFIPSGFSSYKPDRTTAQHRATIAHLAIPQEWLYQTNAGEAAFQLNLENVYGEDVPTVEQFHRIRERYPQAEITFFTGSDWVQPDEKGVIRLAHFRQAELLMEQPILVIPREGYVKEGEVELPGNFKWLEANLKGRSSTEIADRISAGDDSWEHDVPAKVAAYIKYHHLFGYQSKER